MPYEIIVLPGLGVKAISTDGINVAEGKGAGGKMFQDNWALLDSHLHDDRYFTQAQITTLLQGKQDVGQSGNVFTWTNQIRQASPGGTTNLTSFYPSQITSGLEIKASIGWNVKASTITTESAITVESDVNNIINGAPNYVTSSENRGVQIPINVGALDQQTATISWLWNGVQFRAVLTVITG
jgi:hypothetical protein